MKAHFAYHVVESQLFARTPGEISAAVLNTDGSALVQVKLFNYSDATDDTKCLGTLMVAAGAYVNVLDCKGVFGFWKLFVEFTQGSGELVLYVRDPAIWALHEVGYGELGFGEGGFGG